MNAKIKSFINAIFAKDDKIKANKAAKEKALAESKEAYKKAGEDADAAIEAEDMAAFRKADNKKRELEQDAEFLEKTISKLAEGVSDEEVIDTWEHISDLYNKDFKEKWAAYEKARKALAKQFLEILAMQNEIFSVRDDLAALGHCALEDVECVPHRFGKQFQYVDLPPAVQYNHDSALILREVVGVTPGSIDKERIADVSAYLYQVIINHAHWEPDITL